MKSRLVDHGRAPERVQNVARNREVQHLLEHDRQQDRLDLLVTLPSE